jgi:putative holliday junction resolvase
MTRVVGVDLGSRRIGVAVSDSGRVLATPYRTVERAVTREADHATLAAVVAEVEATAVVVGLPISLDGTMGPAARAVLDEVETLRGSLTVPVHTVDERLTTVTASRELQAAGVRGRARRRVIDQSAAAVILQCWLDAGPRT